MQSHNIFIEAILHGVNKMIMQKERKEGWGFIGSPESQMDMLETLRAHVCFSAWLLHFLKSSLMLTIKWAATINLLVHLNYLS